MNVSVLLPSRGRPRSLAESLSGLLQRAEKPDQIELLVALDPDDAGSYLAKKEEFPTAVTWWVAPERFGYARLHEYYNELAKRATGEWLFLWNDDARMLTQNWDSVALQQPPGVLFPKNNTCPTEWCCNCFPLWPRSWTEAVGHVSLAAQCDSWWQEIGNLVGKQVHVPIEIFHDRADVTGGHNDSTYEERDLGKEVFFSLAPQRIADAGVIRRLT